MENIKEKKKAIFEGTLDLIKEHGFHGCPMSMVARSSGVATGTIYHYFESKDELIYELYYYVNERLVKVVEGGDDKSRPFKDRFFLLWMNLYSFYIGNPNILRFFDQFIISPYFTRIMEEGYGPLYKLLFAFFEEGIREGHLRMVNPEIMGVLAHGNIIIASKTKEFGKIPLEDAELTQIFQILWDGMSAK